MWCAMLLRQDLQMAIGILMNCLDNTAAKCQHGMPENLASAVCFLRYLALLLSTCVVYYFV